MCTVLHELVYKAVKQVPKGKVTTYGAIARALGDPIAARTVARILSENKDPEEVPCYRVVMSDGSLGGYAFGGPEEKARRLREDGVEVLSGKVNLKKYLFTDFDVYPILRRMAEAQRKIAEMNEPVEVEVDCVVGLDVAYKGCTGVGAAVAMDRDGEIIGVSTWKGRVAFPYVPTYLAFREVPFMVKSGERWRGCLFFVDGQGTAHPRKAGEAVHVGAVLRVPSIGIAKSPLLRGQKPTGKAYISPGWGYPPLELVREFWFRGKKQPEVLEEAHRVASTFIKKDR